MVQHFDHVLHHLTSAAIKEHVPPTAQHGGKRQRGLMEATVINFFIKWSRTHSAIIFRKTPSKKRRDQSLEIWVFETNYNGWSIFPILQVSLSSSSSATHCTPNPLGCNFQHFPPLTDGIVDFPPLKTELRELGVLNFEGTHLGEIVFVCAMLSEGGILVV
ncbi:hypothetical protein CK203_084444 [Vitis vinifera]|uniref:Uncharacterized protein n=1 Tax=Vitis vinifera TaxID=29760 RepID=A0A438EN05_VITVI|nr:hypothetical protein CK203_084444 [Vitis vinifera]